SAAHVAMHEGAEPAVFGHLLPFSGVRYHRRHRPRSRLPFPIPEKTMTSGFHVHGPHDHELEHAAQHGDDPMAGQLAVITAILATVGATFSYMGGNTQAEAALAKNNAAIRKTEASDTWNYYQSKNIKQMLAELAVDLVPQERREKITKDIERYKSEKDPIMA